MARGKGKKSYSQKLQSIIDLDKSGVVKAKQILELIDIKEKQITLKDYMKHIRMRVNKEKNEVCLVIPEVNHHQLQINEEKYKKMRREIKLKMEKNFFNKKMHVVVLNTNEKENGVQFGYQGRKQQYHHETSKTYGEFVFDTETDDSNYAYSPLDGLHRTFAIADIMAFDTNCDKILKTVMHVSFYYPSTSSALNEEDTHRYRKVLQILSKIIADDSNLSLNSTLYDAVASVVAIEDVNYTTDFLSGKVKIDGGDVPVYKLKMKDMRKHCLQQNPHEDNVVNMFKSLIKSEDFLILFKSKWKRLFQKDSDFKEEFWKKEKDYFLKNEKIKLFFIKEYECSGHNFRRHIRNETPNYSVEKTGEMQIEYACYGVARAIEPLFFDKWYRGHVSSCLDQLASSALITVHRLLFMSTIAYETSDIIVEEFYRYSEFTNGNDQAENYVLKSKDQKVTTKQRKAIVCRIFFNYILTQLWQLYGDWKKVFNWDEKSLKNLSDRLRDTSNSLLLKRTYQKKEKFNLGVDMVDYLTPTSEKASKEEKLDNLRVQVMDLLALRYADYIRIMLAKNGPRTEKTLPFYEFCITSGRELDPKHFNFQHSGFRVHYFDLIDKAEEIYQIFKNSKDEDIQEGFDEYIIEECPRDCYRNILYLKYMQNRFGIDPFFININGKDWNDMSEEEIVKNMEISYNSIEFLHYVQIWSQIKKADVSEFLFNPLEMRTWFNFDHSDRTEPTKFSLDFSKLKLKEEGKPNKKWGEYLEEVEKIYHPNIEDEDETNDVAETKWDDLHSKIMERYTNSGDKQTFVAGITNFAISMLVKKNKRMVLKKDKWTAPKDHLTSESLTVPSTEAGLMLSYLDPHSILPPFIGNSFFCTQTEICDRKKSPRRQRSSPSKQTDPSNYDVIEKAENNIALFGDDDSSSASSSEEDEEIEIHPSIANRKNVRQMRRGETPEPNKKKQKL